MNKPENSKSEGKIEQITYAQIADDKTEKRHGWRKQFGAYVVAIAIIFSVSYLMQREDPKERAREEAEKEAMYVQGYNEAIDYAKGKYAPVAEYTDELYETMLEKQRESNFFREFAACVAPGGKEYHRYNCDKIYDSVVVGTIQVCNIETAQAAGHTPCSDCWEEGQAEAEGWGLYGDWWNHIIDELEYKE